MNIHKYFFWHKSLLSLLQRYFLQNSRTLSSSTKQSYDFGIFFDYTEGKKKPPTKVVLGRASPNLYFVQSISQETSIGTNLGKRKMGRDCTEECSSDTSAPTPFTQCSAAACTASPAREPRCFTSNTTAEPSPAALLNSCSLQDPNSSFSKDHCAVSWRDGWETQYSQ